jgi:phosphatidylinositol alpha-1,6-mannosyltransferase
MPVVHLPVSGRGRYFPTSKVPALPRNAALIVRLLYVSHSFPPPDRPLANVGGMQRVATELHAALDARPDVALRSLLLRASWRWTHLRVVPFGLRLLREIPRTVRSEQIDVVLFSSMVTASLTVPLRRKLEAQDVLTAAIPVGRDVTLPVGPYQWYLPRIFGALDLILPISRATAEECLHRGAAREKVQVIPCGVDPMRFPPLEDRNSMRRVLHDTLGDPASPLPPGALLLCGVGRHIERKGFAWFVDRVMPLLPSDIHFWLAGEGPTTPAVRAAIERNNLGDRVRLLGRISDEALTKLYRGADLFVMPNVPVPGDIEGFGVVMLEAGFCGLPTVAARLEGIQDAIRDGENGTLLPSGNATAFARGILRYHQDRALLAEASARAARYTAGVFSWDAVAAQYVSLFRTTMARRDEHGATQRFPHMTGQQQ